MVLHVTGGQVFGRRVVKLGKQVARHLAQRIDQHVQTAAVGHADHDFLHALGARLLDQLVHGGNKALATFERETLLAYVLGVQEALQAFGCRQAVQNVFLLLRREIRLAANGLQLLLPPTLLVLVRGVHELGAQGAAVGLAQGIHQVAQTHGVAAEEGVAGIENGFLVRVAETVERQFQFRNVVARKALERVQIGPARSHVAVGGNQLLHGGALAPHLRVGAGRQDYLGTTLFGALGESIDHGQVGHVPGIAAIASRHVLQRVKILAPRVRHACGIGKIVFVHLFDVWRIATEKVRIAGVGLIDRRWARLLRRSFTHIPLTSVSLQETLAG